MGELPKRFPEYSIMYKTLTKKIQELKLKIKSGHDETSIQKEIEKYESERQKIKKMFPKKFFGDIK